MKTGLAVLGLTAVLAPVPKPAAADELAIHVAVVGGEGYRDDRYRRRDRREHRRYRAGHAWQRGFERGLDQGYGKGRTDARKHRGFDPWRHSRFRKATSGYRSRFGPRPAYRDGYREGFLRAYERGFQRHHRDGRRGRRDDGRRGRRW